MDNYVISRDRACNYFLRFDQNKMIDDWNLRWDAQNLYVTFFGREYGICRKSGLITRLWDNTQADFEETLSIFDLLCHHGTQKTISGNFAPVNSLKGAPKAGGVSTDFYSKSATYFDGNIRALRMACEALDGTPVDLGDVGFQFLIFQKLSVILKFYHSDMDFPATVTLLWDENMLQFVHYETVFYIAGVLLREIIEEMDKGK